MELPLPTCVHLEPVGRGQSSTRAPAPALMSFDAYCRLVDEFPALAQIEFSAPVDPLLHPRFFDMVRYAGARGLQVSARSELLSLSPARAEECVTSGLYRLQVALEPPRPRLANEVRVAAPFSRALRNVTRLVEAKRRLGASLPQIELLDIVTRSKLALLPDLARSAQSHGADALCVLDVAESARAMGLMRAFIDTESLRGEDPAVLERAFAETRALAQSLGIGLRLPSLEPGERCQRPWRSAYIGVAGQATPCSMAPGAFGNVLREGAARVWNADAYRDFRERLASDNPPEPCKGCAFHRGNAAPFACD